MVGLGIVAVLLAAGHRVIAVGRRQDALADLAGRHQSPALTIVAGGVGSAAAAAALAAELAPLKPDAVVVTVNGFTGSGPVFALGSDELERVMHENLSAQLLAAQHLIPVVAEGGDYLGIGGGMAELVFPGNAAMSMAQAAQRALYAYLAKEGADRPVRIRELLLYSMITPGDLVIEDEPYRISAEEVGRHVEAVLNDPESFAGPILTLKSKKQIGLPERPA